MKKLSVIVIALLAMMSCSNTYTTRHVVLHNEDDSLNYALGLLNGAQIKQYYLKADDSNSTVNEFIDALVNGYEGKVEELTDIERAGQSVGFSAKDFYKKGLAERSDWAYNGKIFMQAMVNAMYQDSSVFTLEKARNYFQSQFYSSVDSTLLGNKAVSAKFPTKQKDIAISTKVDTLNYAFGYLNGVGIAKQLFNEDSFDADLKLFADAVNKALKTKSANPQLVQMGEQIGQTISKQEEIGLMGVDGIVTIFDLIQQGFVNGMLGYEEQMTAAEANTYVNDVMNRRRYGDTEAEGKRFLEENATKEGVIVTESGLQYEIIVQGKGKKPTATDNVTVHYHGTLIDGTVFDSSVERGNPASFALNQVIPGWTEGLQLMPVGSTYRFYIPQELGYGSRAAGSIPPYSTLIFEVKLLSID